MNGSAANASPEALVQAYLEGALSDDDMDTLRDWLSAESGNMVEFVRQLDVHASLLERFVDLGAQPEDHPGQLRIYGGSARKVAFRRLTFLAVAASLLIGVGVAMWFMTRPGPVQLGSVAEGEVMIQRGTDRISAGKDDPVYVDDELEATAGAVVRLSDGSTLKMDKGVNIVLKHPGDDGRSDLLLRHGRVFLRVAKGQGHFRVAGSAKVSVLGTVFGVEEDGARTNVNVLEGRVELASGSGEGKIILIRGQSGVSASDTAPKRTGVDPNQALIWARERITFEDRPLGDVLEWIEANSSYRFDISGRHRASNRVSVTVADEPMREIIEAVMLSCGLDYRYEKHDIRVR